MRAFHEFAMAPGTFPGPVYNIGGGIENSCSILEAIDTIKEKTGIELKTKHGDKRKGDHEVYYTNYSHFQKIYSNWKITRDLDSIFDELLG